MKKVGLTMINDLPRLIQESFNVTLSMDQIQRIVDMGDNPSDYDIQKIRQMVGRCGTVGEESIGPVSTSILEYIRGFKPENDTLYFDSSMVIPSRRDGNA